jgi:hypothetical protein
MKKKNIWIWIVRPLMMIIEFPIVFTGTLFLMISEVFMKIQNYLNKINIECNEYFDPPRNYILQIHGKDKEIWTRVNDKLLTKKEAEKLGEEYKNQGYEIHIS